MKTVLHSWQVFWLGATRLAAPRQATEQNVRMPRFALDGFIAKAVPHHSQTQEMCSRRAALAQLREQNLARPRLTCAGTAAKDMPH
jgi:hypothetical protein